MKFTVEKKEISEPLSLVSSVAEKRQSIPVLSNILLKAHDSKLTLIATDLEIELTFIVENLQVETPGETTVSARKMADLIRSVPEDTMLTFELIENQLEISALKFFADFSTLPVGDFPVIEQPKFELEVALPGKELSSLIENTSFAMASQDVRYYLNGVLLEVSPTQINVVATDGHRLAWSSCKIKTDFLEDKVIIPRKSALELQKLLSLYPENVSISFNSSQLKVFSDNFSFISKLIEGSYPDYQKVFPSGEEQKLQVEKTLVQTALNRASVLSNEKYRGVKFILEKNNLKICANNPSKESAEEEVPVKYDGILLRLGLTYPIFKSPYLLSQKKMLSLFSMVQKILA
jgi:DNA polymerase-3 subunit beta